MNESQNLLQAIVPESDGTLEVKHGDGNVFLVAESWFIGLTADQAKSLGQKIIDAANLEIH